MTRFDGVLDHQVRSLRDALRRHQESRCREIVAAAERQAQQALGDARSRMRERQHQAVSEERQQREHELLTARSRIETSRRRHTFNQHEQVLKMAWPLLVEALAERWSDAELRLAWCDMIVTEAAATLPGREWIVEHPRDFTKADRDAIVRRTRQLGCATLMFQDCKDMTEGLRITAGSACLDGTSEGLLSARSEVEAQLLAAWVKECEGDRG